MSVQTEDAQITSTAVEIDTLRVSGRQLTLRTFRQLQRAPVIDPETHEVRGSIWGWVNYFWDGNEGDVHAVWQDGKVLRRSPVCYLGGAKELLYAYEFNGMQAPSRYGMPSEKLKRAVNDLESSIKDMRPPRYKRVDCTGAVKRIYQTYEFAVFSELVDEWDQRVRAVEDEGQLFIAT